MPFVLDASVTLAWCLEDERSPQALSVLNDLRRNRARVPGIWPAEVTNALLAAERRKRISQRHVDAALGYLLSLPIDIAVDANGFQTYQEVLSLARRLGTSVYDAAYLHLAETLTIPLATLDKRLITPARKLRLELVP
jgi:predicted nucleic acid-binding protein